MYSVILVQSGCVNKSQSQFFLSTMSDISGDDSIIDSLITTKLALVGFGYSEETMHLLLTEYRGFTEEEAEYAIDNLDERDLVNSKFEYIS